VTTVTLHGPSNDAASADVPAANIVTAKNVASVTARMEWLIMGTLVLRRLKQRLVVVVLPFFHHGQSDGWPRSKLGAAWLAEGIRRKKGPSPSALLKWTVSHPPHDRVIIVFDQGHALYRRRRPKFEP
jgi:hypothetical protein